MEFTVTDIQLKVKRKRKSRGYIPEKLIKTSKKIQKPKICTKEGEETWERMDGWPLETCLQGVCENRIVQFLSKEEKKGGIIRPVLPGDPISRPSVPSFVLLILLRLVFGFRNLSSRGSRLQYPNKSNLKRNFPEPYLRLWSVLWCWFCGLVRWSLPTRPSFVTCFYKTSLFRRSQKNTPWDSTVNPIVGDDVKEKGKWVDKCNLWSFNKKENGEEIGWDESSKIQFPSRIKDRNRRRRGKGNREGQRTDPVSFWRFPVGEWGEMSEKGVVSEGCVDGFKFT